MLQCNISVVREAVLGRLSKPAHEPVCRAIADVHRHAKINAYTVIR